MVEGEGARVEWLDLVDAIALLRDQVAQARARLADPAGGGDQGVRFALGEVTVALGVELARTRGGEGGLRFGVAGSGVSAGGSGAVTRSGSHTVTVVLTAQDALGGPVEVRDRG